MATSSRRGRGSRAHHARTITGRGWEMETNADERLERAIGIVEELIGLVRETGSQSQMFLEMARLQLQLDLNGITEDEFGAFCDALERGEFAANGGERVRVRHPRA